MMTLVRCWILLLVCFAVTSLAQDRVRVPPRTQQLKLRKKVAPVYPPKAKAAKIEGTVRLTVIIAKNGSVESTQVIEGPVELRRAASEAVEKYVYEPTTVNGELVGVISEVEVAFALDPAKR